MADCVSLLDEELSSFVFNYLTENSGSQYGEEEVCSDRLDTDFPDFDLSQLDASDFDSVNCLSELHWCNDHSDSSPASIHNSVGDPELFEIEEENAALLAALTDSLGGVGVLSVFPSLGDEEEEDEEEKEGKEHEEEEEDELPLDSEPFPGSLSPETKDPSLLEQLLLSPPNVPVGLDPHRESSSLRRTLHLKTVRPLAKSDRMCAVERKPRAVRPAGRLCTELHRHLTSSTQNETADAEETHSHETEVEEDEEDEDDEEDSDSEDEEEEEEESSSSSEVESSAPVEPPKPQFTSEKELHSVVELVRYMHTYCLPSRKQASWDRKERESVARRPKPETAPASRFLKAAPIPIPVPGNAGGRPRIPFARRREMKAHSLLKELLEAVTSYDVSKPYRLHSAPYVHSRGPADSPQNRPKADPKDCGRGSDGGHQGPTAKRPKSPEEPEEGSFSVRRSRRLASFPSRFAKKLRPADALHSGKERQRSADTTPLGSDTLVAADDVVPKTNPEKRPESQDSCCNEKRACLCLPLTPKSTGDAPYTSRPFEQTLCVELCGTAGLTPPTTPPHKPVEEELFKPEAKSDPPAKALCGPRAHGRKLPEQTELYAQLRRMGQTGEGKRAYGDHDYCLLNLGESRKRSAALLVLPPPPPPPEQKQGGQVGQKEEEEEEGKDIEMEDEARPAHSSSPTLSPGEPEEPMRNSPSRSPVPETDATVCSPPSPYHQLTLSCETSGTFCRDTQRNNAKHGQEETGDKCQVFYIHNLPSGVTQDMLRKRFEAFGDPEDCKVLIKNEERCGVITFRQSQKELNVRHRRDSLGQHGGGGGRRFGRKRYIDLDEAGPGPVKSKYDALDFDTLLKEAQRSLHR